MTSTIWYISKYVTPPSVAKVGGRGFMLAREFVRFGHKVLLITSDSNHLAKPPVTNKPRTKETIDGVDIYWLRTLKYSGARSFRRILSWLDFEWQLLKMFKTDLPTPDIIIVSSLSLLTIFNGIFLRWRYRCKLVFEVRDIWPLVLTTAGGFSVHNPVVKFLGWVERLGYRSADLIVGTMPNLGEHVFEVSGSTKPVVCVPQGVSDEMLAPPAPLPEDFVETYIPHGCFNVCHAGSIGADNALETFFSCAKMLVNRRDINFIVVGDGYLKEMYRQNYQALDNVIFAPSVPKAAVQSLLENVDLVYFAVHKSPLMRFGQSLNKLIDYMLSGKPVLASFSGFESMVNEANCGRYVPAEDAAALCREIERYADMSPEQRSLLGENGRKWLLTNRKYDKLAHDYLKYLGVE